MGRVALRRSIFVGTALLGAAACRSPTEVTLVLTTDAFDAGVGATSITVVSSSAGLDAGLAALTTNCSPDGSIGSLVVVPGSAGATAFVVKVVTDLNHPSTLPADCDLDASHCIIATREMSFINHTPLLLPIQMDRSCEGVACDGGLTCVQRQCVSPRIVPGACLGPAGCNLDTGHDSGAPGSDAGLDAGHDAGHVAKLILIARVDGGLPEGIGVNATSVFWSDLARQTIYRAVKSPDAGAPNLFADVSEPGDLIVADANVCWIQTSDEAGTMDVLQCAPVLGPVPPNAVIAWAHSPDSHLAYGGGSAWVGFTDTIGPFLIDYKPEAGLQPLVSEPTPTVGRVAANDTYFFRASVPAQGAQIARASVGSPAAETPWLAQAASDLLADPTNLYWINGHAIFSRAASAAPSDAGPASPLAREPQLSPVRLAVDGAHLFWTATGGSSGCNGAVSMVPKSGGPPTVIATGQCDPGAITADDAGVYWVNHGDGTVRAIRSP
jgi:hypothetical protein